MRGRAAEIVAAYDKWDAEHQKQPRGLEAAICAYEKAADIETGLEQQIDAIQATTIEGMIAKARCAEVYHFENGTVDLCRSIVEDLLALRTQQIPEGFQPVIDKRGKADEAADRAIALIAEKRVADVAHNEAIDAQDEAEIRYGVKSVEAEEACDRCRAACQAVTEIDWQLANTPPTTLAGVAAVLRFTNEIEDGGMEWPATDMVGREGWHYQLRATMAETIEQLVQTA